MDMAMKALSPQLQKLAGVISNLEKDCGTKEAALMIKTEVVLLPPQTLPDGTQLPARPDVDPKTGEVKKVAVLILTGFDNGHMRILKDGNNRPMKYTIDKIGQIIMGASAEELSDDND